MNVVIIGAGNVGTHFARALKSANIPVLQVVSRTMKSAVELASELGCSFATDYQDINPHGDIYILCVSDDSISSIVRQLPIQDKLVVHTSGSVGIKVFYDYATNYGCIYPLQSFSKFKDLNYAEIPVFVEANTEENQQILIDLMKQITPHVQVLSSQQRAIIHLCGVLVNNFSNHLYTLAEMMMKDNQLQFELLKPLLKETYEKMLKYSPYISQTGPAVRNDEIILQRHRDLLADNPDVLNIYNAMTESIKKTHSENK
ncbi:MAG: F420-dependent NADP oxidoreductase [Bacteroidales bacterium]|nr:F420-dependent NADP oxidoreductase [Bacteroidales bacterium]